MNARDMRFEELKRRGKPAPKVVAAVVEVVTPEEVKVVITPVVEKVEVPVFVPEVEVPIETSVFTQETVVTEEVVVDTPPKKKGGSKKKDTDVAYDGWGDK